MKRKILSIFTLAVVLFSGCQKEDTAPTIESNYPLDGVVRIATSVNALQTRTSPDNYTGTDISLSVDYGTGDKYTQENVQWTQSNNLWTSAANDVMVWKDAKTTTQIYAYAPYVAEQDHMTAVKFSAQTDQSQDLTSSDLVGFAERYFTPDTDLVENAIPIELSHKMSRLNINLTFGNEFDVTPTVQSVSVLAKTAVRYNAITAAAPIAINTDAVAITPNKIDNATYSVIIAPQTVANSTKLVTVVIGDESYSYEVSDANGGHNFTSNTSYEIKLRIGKDKLELADDIKVGEWVAGGVIEGGEALPPAPDLIEGFDFLLFRISWNAGNGKDLDTATAFENTSNQINDSPSGYGFEANTTTTKYLNFAGDMSDPGNGEYTYINIKKLLEDKTDLALNENITIKLYATWYTGGTSAGHDGFITLKVDAYSGGDMKQKAKTYYNEGGGSVYNETHTKLVSTGRVENTTSYKSQYTQVCIVVYNITTKIATLTML